MAKVPTYTRVQIQTHELDLYDDDKPRWEQEHAIKAALANIITSRPNGWTHEEVCRAVHMYATSWLLNA